MTSTSAESPATEALEQLVADLEPFVEAGQRELAFLVRRLLHRVAPEVFGVLPYLDDTPFLEPLGIRLLVSGERCDGAELLAAYSGYIDPARRSSLWVGSDPAGRIYVPRLGVAEIGRAGTRLPLEWDGDGFTVEGRGRIVWKPFHAIEHLDAELAVGCAGPLATGLPGESGQRVSVSVATPTQTEVDLMNSAVAAIRETAPAVHRLIRDVARLVVLFKDTHLDSFASPAAHGVAFLNIAPGASVPAFVEDVVHQFGHTLFTSAAADGGRYLAVSPDLPLGRLTGDPGDTRPTLIALHGILTESLIVGVLDSCINAEILEPDALHETFGRLAFVVHKLAHDLRNFSDSSALTASGRQLLSHMESVYCSVVACHGDGLRSRNLSGQGYTFDYEIYRRANSLDVAMP